MAEMDDQKLEDLMRALGITPGAGGETPTEKKPPEEGEGKPPPKKPPAPPGGPEEPPMEPPGRPDDEPPVVMPDPVERQPEFKSFDVAGGESTKASIDLIKDIKLKMKIELGRARLPINEVLSLQAGSVVELDRLTGDPLDILVNDVLVARGEVLVINENFAIRITEVVTPQARADDQMNR